LNRFVIDNSVVLSWCLEDEQNRYSTAILERMDACEALVPAIWPLEFTNALLMAERRKRIAEADVTHFLAMLKNIPIHVEPESVAGTLYEILPLARIHGLTTYDASYLNLAMRSGLPIATQDKALVKAARKCGVEIFGEKQSRKKS
jgi:predicted nucleic acid-binding protein